MRCVAILVLLSLLSASISLRCVGENGEDVDWWIILKAPTREVDDPNVSKGLGFSYIDSSNIVNNFALRDISINNPKSPLMTTLSPLYGKNQKMGYLMYNDQPPGSTHTTSAHAKGVMGFDQNGAFWLIHSVPRFPAGPSAASSPDIEPGQRIYGQSMICISLSGDQVEGLVAKNLNSFEANFYESSFPASISSLYPNLYAVANDKAGTRAVTSFFNLTSHGVPFFHFAKNAKWGLDLYADMVSPYFGEALMVETWMRPREASFYPPRSKYEVVNVNSVNFPSLPDSYGWPETSDHSKWAISTFPSGGLFCIGDINKQESQTKRGGGTMCALNCNIYSAFASMVKQVDKFTPPTGRQSQCTISKK
eukprot:TRINITY_DN3983_c0_g1_i1.p1 TRINITY_DN3983_c0_g1~~TRINITY_DN3983_c0_g1_i1.p1  ORF type:complete len:365 (+),score=30.75 TRINITY_DN3983_c0_g1_i1:120-1214(+)